MHYLGGKHRIAKDLSAYLLQRLGGRLFVEPFCGALNITAAMEPAGYRVATDRNPYLHVLYEAVRRGWQPPEHVDYALWDHHRRVQDPSDPMTAFVGYGCSFGGTWFGAYARNVRGIEDSAYAGRAKRSLLKKIARCRDARMACVDYRSHRGGPGMLIYCDPPYGGTTGYRAVGKFDSAEFWQVCRDWSRAGAIALVSEYSAPPDFVSVWEKSTFSTLDSGATAGEVRVERLFEWGH